jgi:hypothetical protein
MAKKFQPIPISGAGVEQRRIEAWEARYAGPERRARKAAENALGHALKDHTAIAAYEIAAEVHQNTLHAMECARRLGLKPASLSDEQTRICKASCRE